MSVVCPAVTAETTTAYQAQLERVEPFAGRIHLDVADGTLAPRKLIDLDKLWWPGNKLVDIHVMYQQPFVHTELLLVQHPTLVIVHAEAEGDFNVFAAKMHRHGIEVGIALLPQTAVSTIAPALSLIDHVLIVSGQVSKIVDPTLLTKVRQLRSLKPALEIGWEGGISDVTVRQLVASGVDVLNVGDYVQQAASPARAYATLVSVT